MFGDPLLVRHGRGVVMTTRAKRLLPELTAVLRQISVLIAHPDTFDASRITRTFTIRANEAVISAAGARLANIFAAEAPYAHIRYQAESSNDVEALRDGEVDLLVGSYSDLTSDLLTEDLLVEHLVGLVRVDHNRAVAKNKAMTLRSYAELDHIDVSRHGRRRTFIDTELAQHGLKRRVVAIVPSFSTALAMVSTSDTTTLAPSRPASIHVAIGGLSQYRPPFNIPKVVVTSVWHGRDTSDAAHVWFRSAVQRAASKVIP